MYEYFIHGSKPSKILDILTYGGLDDNFTSPDDHHKGIYCLYFWDGLPKPFKSFEWNHGEKFLFIIDKSITKENEMFVYDFTRNDDQLLMHTKGSKRLPNMKPLKESILTSIETALTLGRKGKDSRLYKYGHEVIFKGHIPLKYIKALLIHKQSMKQYESILHKIKNYLDEHHIPIIPFANTTNDFHQYFKQI